MPLIYITGAEDPYPHLVKQKEAFARYLAAGGTMLASGYRNNRQFEAGFRKFFLEIVPGTPFKPLPIEHSIYQRWFKFEKPYGLLACMPNKETRPLGLIVTEPFAVPLSTTPASKAKAALQLGTNIVLFLTQLDKRIGFLDDILPPKPKKEDKKTK